MKKEIVLNRITGRVVEIRHAKNDVNGNPQFIFLVEGEFDDGHYFNAEVYVPNHGCGNMNNYEICENRKYNVRFLFKERKTICHYQATYFEKCEVF